MKVYMGIYNDKVYAVSESKDMVKTYMKNIRRLQKDQFVVYKFDIDESELIARYEDMVLVNFNGLMIPEIDVDIIVSDEMSFDILFNDLMEKAIKFTSILGHIEKATKQKEVAMQFLDVLIGIDKRKSLKMELEDDYQMSHPILYCSIKEYDEYIKSHKEKIQRYEEYKYARYK